MKAIKGNMQYKVTEVEASSFQKEGFDIYDDNGKIVKYGAGKTVSFERYLKVMQANEALQNEIIELKEKLRKKESKKKEA